MALFPACLVTSERLFFFVKTLQRFSKADNLVTGHHKYLKAAAEL
jgi:hypothetical protein